MSRFSFLILILFSRCAFVVLLSGTFSSQLCWGPIDWEEGGREWTRVGTIFMASRCPASVQITRSCESVLPVEGRGSGLVEGDCGGELPPPHPHCPPLPDSSASSCTQSCFYQLLASSFPGPHLFTQLPVCVCVCVCVCVYLSFP